MKDAHMISVARGTDIARLTLPRVPTELTVRERLITRLSECHAITVLSAPRGYGKTTLISVWLEREFAKGEQAERTTVIWISAAKIENIDDVAKMTETIEAELAATEGLLLVIVDGYDHAKIEDWEHGVIDLVRENRNIRAIFTGRDPRRPDRWLAIDLDQDRFAGKDIRFSQEESVALLSNLAPHLSEEQAIELHEQVGGWPILVRTAGLAGGKKQAAANFLKNVAEVLHFSHAGREFVAATAHAEYLTVDMTRHLFGAEAETMLHRFESGGLLVRDDSNDSSPRYKLLPIVQQVALDNLGKEVIRARRLELANWCAENKMGESALKYAIAAESWETFRAMAVQFRSEIMQSRELQAAIRNIDPDVSATDPLIATIIDVIDGPQSRVGDIPDAGYGDDAKPHELFSELAAKASFARFNGDFENAKHLFTKVNEYLVNLEPNTPIEPMLPMIALQESLIWLMTDDLHKCAVMLTRLYREARRNNQVIEMRNAAGILALINVFGGNAPEAEHWFTELDAMPDGEGLFEEMVDTCADSARALYALGRLDFEAAKQHIEALNPATAMDEMWPFIVFAQSEYALLNGNIAQGLRNLEAAIVTHSERDQPGTLTRQIIAACRANLLLSQGDGNRALAALRSADRDHPLVRAVEARIELLRGNNQRVIVLAHVSTDNDQSHDRAMRELRLITAIAHLREQEQDEAARIFKRFISDDGVGMLRALALADRGAITELVELSGVGHEDLAALNERLPESPFIARVKTANLTRREQLVLELLHQDMTLSEIAERLVVSSNTVKSQTRSLYRKLEVNSRADAVQRAAEYGLI